MASASQQQYRPRVLISNDDGITAPGLVALAEAIRLDGFAAFSVSAPSGERSAQSHCISIGKHLHAWELPVPGADEAFAVDGTPADSVSARSENDCWLAAWAGLHALPLSPTTAVFPHQPPCR